jgi:Mn2+/Fe2+ NRAMP family transporter
MMRRHRSFASIGADYGYRLLWLLIPLFSLGIVQEMCARMGAVTGKGLSDLIRERFGCDGRRLSCWRCWSRMAELRFQNLWVSQQHWN